ncbi:hypothetical protein [Deinococcus apachensis]|uniref:hypothetical protein n=1 Tax=Deinococcus apachensis TaxID=309886 RepID=UPI00039E7FBF|nr:hypothetical protein [Deinococcus apachensis]
MDAPGARGHRPLALRAELWGACEAAWDAHYAFYAFLDAAPRFAKIRNELEERARSVPTCEARRALYDEAARAYMDGLRPFVRGQEQAMARWASLRVKHETALAANVADPQMRLSLRLGIEAAAKSLYSGPMVDSAWIMSEVEEEVCSGANPPGAKLDAQELPNLVADSCGGLTTGGKLKSKVPSESLPFEGYGLSFGVSCKGLDIKLSPSFKTAFNVAPVAQLSLGWNGTATIFTGVKAELKQPKGNPLSSSNKSGLSLKESLYLKFDRGGIADVGMPVEVKATLGAGPDRDAALWEGKIDQEFGVAAAAYWRER